MRPAERAEMTRTILKDLSALHSVETAISKLQSRAGHGYPSGSGTGRGGGHGDPTATSAFHSDPDLEHLARLETAHRELSKAAAVLSREVKSALMVSQDPGNPECDSCSRVKDAQGARRWNIANFQSTTVGGRLTLADGNPRLVNLCQSCYDAIRSHDLHRLPPTEWVTTRFEGGHFDWATWKTGGEQTLYKDYLTEHAATFAQNSNPSKPDLTSTDA